MFFDPMYFLFLAPGILLALWAQWRVKSAFMHAGEIAPRSGMSGAEAAATMLHSAGVTHCNIEPVGGFLSDHYDPSSKTLRLSSEVYQARSLAAMGVACHEAGHALQDARGYAPLVVRNALVPMANFGGSISWILIMLGFVLASANLLYVGIGAFSLTVLFQVVNLPVEFDASARARRALVDSGMVDAEEDREVGRVLNAAALTYVAATLTSILTLLYFLFRAGLLGGSRDE